MKFYPSEAFVTRRPFSTAQSTTQAPMNTTAVSSHCGLCGQLAVGGFSSSGSSSSSDAWAAYHRAVYCIGPDASQPRLSGLGYHQQGSMDNYLPLEAHQRYDDEGLNPLSLVQIRDIKPPGPGIPEEERPNYAWGFFFHDACWNLLEQAVKPDKVNVHALWRILVSVPCGSDLPNWGHNYGGLYMGTVKDQARGEHFVLLGPNSNLVIPSTFANPFVVPELKRMIASMRIEENDGEQGSTKLSEIVRSAGSFGFDPFAKLPLELKELLLCYMKSVDILNLRLASKELATMTLTQHFFQSRFWPDREMNVFFDAFSLPLGERRGVDWSRLYSELKLRLSWNRVCLGERNRLRIWNQTVKPLANSLEQLKNMSEFRGGPGWRWDQDGNIDVDWNFAKTAKSQVPEAFGESGRILYRAERELPGEEVTRVYVSFMVFFETKYVTGLRFVFANGSDVEIGYILQGSEQPLDIVAGFRGFHCAIDECGFRALAIISGELSEYLEWAGDAGSLPSVVVRANAVRRVRAAFDGFRLQALLIPERIKQ